jgi:hypothetical protein
MTELDQAISNAYKSQGRPEDVNQVYLLLLKSPMFLPVKKETKGKDDEPFHPLYAVIDGKYFMLAFDTLERLKNWARDQMDYIDYVEITGRDLIAGINENVFFVLNVETEFYKEFSPDEVVHLKKIVSKIDQLKS